MTRTQKLALTFGILVMLSMTVFPPWKARTGGSLSYHFIGAPPGSYSQPVIDTSRWFIQYLTALTILALLYRMCRRDEGGPPIKTTSSHNAEVPALPDLGSKAVETGGIHNEDLMDNLITQGLEVYSATQPDFNDWAIAMRRRFPLDCEPYLEEIYSHVTQDYGGEANRLENWLKSLKSQGKLPEGTKLTVNFPPEPTLAPEPAITSSHPRVHEAFRRLAIYHKKQAK